jgi:hypothetical protein
MQMALQQRLEAAQQTPPRVREAESQLRAEQARIEALLEENAALSMRAQHLQVAAAPRPGAPLASHAASPLGPIASAADECLPEPHAPAEALLENLQAAEQRTIVRASGSSLLLVLGGHHEPHKCIHATTQFF